MRTLQYFQKKKKNFAPENMKKPPSKVAHNRPKLFFSVLPTGPKSAQISYSFHKNGSLRDFYIMTWDIDIMDMDLDFEIWKLNKDIEDQATGNTNYFNWASVLMYNIEYCTLAKKDTADCIRDNFDAHEETTQSFITRIHVKPCIGNLKKR